MASLAHDGLIPAGLLEYAPLAHAAEPVRGGDHWIIHCIWVIPPFAARRLGSELVVGALRDLRSDPSVPPDAGLAVIAYRGTKWWGFFDYMPEALFTLHGFRPVDQDGPRVLMYRSLAPGASATPPGGEEPPGRLPYLIPSREHLAGPEPPGPGPAAEGGPEPRDASRRTHVRLVYHSRCPAAVWVSLQLEAAARGRPDLYVESVDSRAPGVLQGYGVANGIYVNGRLALHQVPSPAEVMAAAGIGRPS